MKFEDYNRQRRSVRKETGRIELTVASRQFNCKMVGGKEARNKKGEPRMRKSVLEQN